MRREIDIVVVGGGIVGLAAAVALAQAGRSLVVLERREAIAREITSRNSQVIHAGIYYPPGSQKARLCVEGREAIYERCQKYRVPHRALGKLIVATSEDERSALEALYRCALDNGVLGVEWLSAAAAVGREPAVRAVAALCSPRSGIVDAEVLALSFAAEAAAGGAEIALRTELIGLKACVGGWQVEAREASGDVTTLRCAAVVNAAGLAADSIAALAGMDVERCGYRLFYCKGDYFSLAPGAPLSLHHLVYPLPAGAGLGVHATLDLAGRIRFGPDAEYVEKLDYRVDPAKAERFAAAAQRYLPVLRADWLAPEGSGIRPKLAAPGESFRDFVIEEESAAGFPGLVNVIGIESPGLTAAPAIARRVAELLQSL